MTIPLIEAVGLRKHFPVTRGLIVSRTIGAVQAVNGINFSIPPGKTFGLVGESGCGKTTTSRMVLRLESATDGQLLFKGANLATLEDTALRNFRRAVQAVFQDPNSSLSPRMRVGDIVAEPMRATGTTSASQARDEVRRLLAEVGLRHDAAESYPHEFSGGQKQRIAIARALATRPELIVLDEPVSALDVSIRAQIINLLGDIQRDTGVGYLLIAHDLSVVKHMSHEVGVMYMGEIVEKAPSDELYARPLHPYTRALLSAALPARPGASGGEPVLQGELPSPLSPPSGCRFRTRCPHAMPRCAEATPTLAPQGGGHEVACFLHVST
jgi:oligopeptide/dipeptide ABC transporter ATP-binding protein